MLHSLSCGLIITGCSKKLAPEINGNVLLPHKLFAVPSAQIYLTSLFGMVRGIIILL